MLVTTDNLQKLQYRQIPPWAARSILKHYNSEVRQYQFGDDIRAIDWNVTARYNEPYVKVFEEERELTMMLMVDVSGSESFGTKNQLKSEIVTEIAATMAFSATQNNDKIGLILFSDAIELYIPPKKGKSHVLRIIRELIEFQPKSRKTDLSQALKFLSATQKKKAIVFMISSLSLSLSLSPHPPTPPLSKSV